MRMCHHKICITQLCVINIYKKVDFIARIGTNKDFLKINSSENTNEIKKCHIIYKRATFSLSLSVFRTVALGHSICRLYSY